MPVAVVLLAGSRAKNGHRKNNSGGVRVLSLCLFWHCFPTNQTTSKNIGKKRSKNLGRITNTWITHARPWLLTRSAEVPGKRLRSLRVEMA